MLGHRPTLAAEAKDVYGITWKLPGTVIPSNGRRDLQLHLHAC
jgi:hypothetical protein